MLPTISSAEELRPGFDFSDTTVKFTSLHDSPVEQIESPAKLTPNSLSEYRITMEEGGRPRTVLGTKLRGRVQTEGKIEKVLYTLDNGKTWHRTRGKKTWSIFLSQEFLKKNPRLNVTVIAWTEYGEVSQPAQFGPILYRPKPFPPQSEPVPEAPLHPVRKKSIYTGLVYPGISIGYQSKRFSTEMRFMLGGGQKLWGPRISYYVYPYKGGNLYTALDVFQADFEGDLTVGHGWMIGGLGGIQHFLGPYFSFTLDIGPYYVRLEDDLSGLEVEGTEFVVNSALNLHFY